MQLAGLQIGGDLCERRITRLRKGILQGRVAQREVVVVGHDTAADVLGTRASHDGIRRKPLILHARKRGEDLECRSRWVLTHQRSIAIFVSLLGLRNSQNAAGGWLHHHHHHLGIAACIDGSLGRILNLLRQGNVNAGSGLRILPAQFPDLRTFGGGSHHLPSVGSFQILFHDR